MSFQLELLPSSVIGRILSFEDVSYASILLWQCGSKSLQRKLAQGVTHVVLEDQKGRTLILLPKCLSELSSLRYLQMILPRCSLKMDEAVDILLNLSSSLECLILDIYESIGLWSRLALRAPYIPEDPCSSVFHSKFNVFFDRITLFPRLHTIDFDLHSNYAPASLKALPSTLTSLSFALNFGESQHPFLFKSLPSSLERLTLASDSNVNFNFFSVLPPCLTDLDISHVVISFDLQVSDYEALPRSLTSLVLPFSVPWNSSYINALPPRLTSLNSILIEYDSPDEAPPPLSASLTSIELFSNVEYESYIKFLPRGLLTLDTQAVYGEPAMDLTRIRKEDWPPHLTDFSLSNSIKPARINTPPLFVLNLPSSLVHLKLYTLQPVDLTLSSFPLLQTLDVSLMAEYIHKPFDDFPPHLQTLSIIISSNNNHHAPSEAFPLVSRPLPPTIKHLYFSATYKYFFPIRFLPPFLTTLSMPWPRSCLRDAALHSENATLSISTSNRSHDARTASDCEKSYFECLPRSTVDLSLSLSSDAAFAPQEWALLPPALRSLHVHNIHDDLGGHFVDFLPWIPMQHMRVLDVGLAIHLNDGMIRALGRRLRSVCLRYASCTSLTPAAFYDFPPFAEMTPYPPQWTKLNVSRSPFMTTEATE